jgi:hypothetical protein
MPFLPNPRTREEAIADMKQDGENHTVDHPGSTISVHTTSYIRSMLYSVQGSRWNCLSDRDDLGIASYATELVWPPVR